MRIINAEYLKSTRGPRKADTGELGEVCFIGRSNVGKSSLINKLVLQRVARTSSTPGATQLINLYKIQYEYQGARRWALFSDFPGFGYAKVSKETYKKWEGMIGNYIMKNRFIKRIIWLIDVRRDLDGLDESVVDWLEELSIPYSVVLTKADKEGRGFGEKKAATLKQALPRTPILLFSAKEGYGREALLSHIVGSLENATSL